MFKGGTGVHLVRGDHRILIVAAKFLTRLIKLGGHLHDGNV